MTMQWGKNSRTFSSNAQINTLVFNAGLLGAPASATNPVPCTALPCPLAVVVDNTPAEAEQKVKNDLGFFVQDTWTMNKLTLNLGARYDPFNAEVPAESSPAPIGRRSNYRITAPTPRTSPPSRTSRTGTTGRSASPAPTTCSATARPRSRRTPASTSPRRRRATPQNFNPMTYCGSCTGATRMARLRRQQVDSRCRRQRPVQRGVRRHVELRPDHQPARSGPAARLQLGILRVGPA